MLKQVFLSYFVAIFLCYAHLDNEKPYNFRPENNHIDVNDGGNYFIGFDEIDNRTDFIHCYYESDTISGDYPIEKTQPDDTVSSWKEDGGFKPYNNTGICAFSYDPVDDKTPLKWSISALDSITNITYTENVTISFFYNMQLYLDQINVLPTASFVNFFESGDTKLTNCSLSFNNITVNLDINTIKTDDGNHVFKSRLSSLGGGKCGYKVINAQPGDPALLTLYTIDNKGKIYKNQAKLVIVKAEYVVINRTQEAYLGSSTNVICGKESDGSANSDQKYCYLYNPKGALVSHDHMCDYKLDIVTKEDLGIWRCSVGYDYIMEELECTTELSEKQGEKVKTFINNTDNFLIIGCELENFVNNVVDYCRFTRPDGKLFKVTKGGATEFYNTFSTDLRGGKCALEIAKPLREEDKGTWKCEPVLPASGSTGAFLDVEKSTAFNYSVASSINVYLGNSFVVDCTIPLPYPSDYCYITSPNGTQYNSQNNYGTMAGMCLYTVKEADSTHNGSWTCSIAQANGIPDEVIKIDVSIIDLKVLYTNAEVLQGETAELVCNTNGIPLEYCRFVSPRGLSYSLRKKDGVVNDTRINYIGRGLQHGDCGIKISNVQHSDTGKWQCHISSGRKDYAKKVDLTKDLKLIVSSQNDSTPSLAESVGIAAGVLVVLIIIGGIIFYKCSKKTIWSNEPVRYQGRESGSSSGSREAVILQVQQNTYNTAGEGQIIHRVHRNPPSDAQII